MRQKPGLQGRHWCLRFFISPAGPRALFPWPPVLPHILSRACCIHAVGQYWVPQEVSSSSVRAWEVPNEDGQDFLNDFPYAYTFCPSCILGT